jgi:dihydroorotase
MSIMNRREFSYAAIGGATVAVIASRTSILEAAAEKFDLLIKGGRVIAPAARLDAIRDVAISQGRIVAVGSNLTGTATSTVDAHGKLVVPGLLDIHTHAGRSTESPGLLLKDGITGWIDAGTQGADHIGDVVAVARSSTNRARSDQHRTRRLQPKATPWILHAPM